MVKLGQRLRMMASVGPAERTSGTDTRANQATTGTP
jgi:hypothetical protein